MNPKLAIPIFEECVERLDLLEVLMTRTRERLESKSQMTFFLNYEERAKWEQDADRQYAKKLELTRDFTEQMLRKLNDELATKGTFKILAEAVQQQLIKKYQVTDAIKKEKKEREIIKDLKERLQKTSSEMNDQISAKEQEISTYKSELQRNKMRNRKLLELLEKTTQNKCLMVQKELEKSEKELTTELKKMSIDLNLEAKAHEEMITFLNKVMQGLEKQCLSWEERYIQDISELDAKIEELEVQKADNQSQITELQQQLEVMTSVIEEDRQEKEELRLKLEKEERECMAATKIQAWWRGIMVRKGLGSYRKKKGKKGIPKKKKK